MPDPAITSLGWALPRRTEGFCQGDGCRGFANDEFRLNRNLRNIAATLFQQADESLRRYFAHAHKRLADGGEAWLRKSGTGNIVEPHDRNIVRYAQPRFAQSPHRTNRGNVVVRKNRRERFIPGQQFLCDGEADLGSRNSVYDLHGQLGANANIQLLGELDDAIPALF